MIRVTAARSDRPPRRNDAAHDVVGFVELTGDDRYTTDRQRPGDAAVLPVHGALDCVGLHWPPLTTGDVIHLPRDVQLTVGNAGGTPARLLVLHAPMSARAVSEPTHRSPRVVRRRAVRPVRLGRALGFDGVQSTLVLSSETVGACDLLVGFARFAPGGAHAIHRHLMAAEVAHVLEGDGLRHLSQGAWAPLAEGDLTYVGVGEWHGLHNAGPRPADIVFAYLGAGSLDADGYELGPA